jgi:DNA-binding protein HU-beta
MALELWRASEVVEAVADRTGLQKGQVRNVLNALEEVVTEAISNCERIKVANVVQIEPKIRAATKKRRGRNPRTGEEVEIPAKPASVRIAARVLKPAKSSAPSVRKLKTRLAG